MVQSKEYRFIFTLHEYFHLKMSFLFQMEMLHFLLYYNQPLIYL